VRYLTRENDKRHTNIKVVLVVLLDVVGIILGRLPLVHGVEVDTMFTGLDWLEESSESILEATSGQQSVAKATRRVERTIWD